MADKSLWRRFADANPFRGGGPFGTLFPFGGGYLRDKPLAADPAQLREGVAYVDPSRLFAGVATLPYNPSVLVTRKGLNIFDQMKMDEQVKSALLFKKHAVLAAGWEVVSPGDQDEEWEVTTFVRDVLGALPGGMVRALRSLMLGVDYGYSITEKVYGNDGVGSLVGKVVLSRLLSAKPHYFDFESDAHGRVLALLQKYVPVQSRDRTLAPQQTVGGGGVIELPVDKFIVYTHEQEFENPYGRSDLEAAYRAWWVKDNAYKWLAVMLERYGMPPLFLLYNQNAYQDAQVEQLKKVVKGIQNATMGVIPRASKDDLEFWSTTLAGQAKDVFLASLARFDADIAKALLQPSLTGFSGESGGSSGGQTQGSLARSNVHWKAFMYIVEELQNNVATVVNEQLVRQLCDLNFPDLQAYPAFKFARLDDETQLDLFKTWSELVIGKIVNQIPDDETHIRASLGFPENENPEELKQPEVVAGRDVVPGVPDKDVIKTRPVPKAEQTQEMRAFAEKHKGEWCIVAGQAVCVAAE